MPCLSREMVELKLPIQPTKKFSGEVTKKVCTRTNVKNQRRDRKASKKQVH